MKIPTIRQMTGTWYLPGYLPGYLPVFYPNSVTPGYLPGKYLECRHYLLDAVYTFSLLPNLRLSGDGRLSQMMTLTIPSM